MAGKLDLPVPLRRKLKGGKTCDVKVLLRKLVEDV